MYEYFCEKIVDDGASVWIQCDDNMSKIKLLTGEEEK
jgi:hypothetical protein